MSADSTINPEDLRDCLQALNLQPPGNTQTPDSGARDHVLVLRLTSVLTSPRTSVDTTTALPEEPRQTFADLAVAGLPDPQLSPMVMGGEAGAESHWTAEVVPVGIGGEGQQQQQPLEQFRQSLSQIGRASCRERV